MPQVTGELQVRLEAVHVGTPVDLGDGLMSAIAKRRVVGDELTLSTINLAGDDQADRSVHGGPDKAVYAYPVEHRRPWAEELDQPGIVDADIAPFGENLSTSGALEQTVRIGDRWMWGAAVLEVCQPRWPCQKLTVHRGSARVGSLMRRTGRTGWYLRVVTPGVVPTSGTITVARHEAEVTVADAHSAMLDRHLDDRALVERVVALGSTLADEWRVPLVERLG